MVTEVLPEAFCFEQYWGDCKGDLAYCPDFHTNLCAEHHARAHRTDTCSGKKE